MRRSVHQSFVVLQALACIVITTFIGAARADETTGETLFDCRSPVLANSFWKSLNEMRAKGVSVSKEIASQVCEGMKAGTEPQCLAVQVVDIKPIANSNGALAIAEGTKRVWFHNPDTGGWVNTDYFIWFVNRPSSNLRR